MTEIRDRLRRLGEDTGADPAAAGIRIHLSRHPEPARPHLLGPMLYLVFQGGKRLSAAGRDYWYGADALVVMAIDLPMVVEITEASAQLPYLSLEIPIDREMLTSLIAKMPPREMEHAQPIVITPLPTSILEPTLRLLRLADSPADAAILSSDVQREIYYRVLSTPAGDSLRGLVAGGSALAGIDATTRWIRDHLSVPMAVDDLAAMAHMSVTTFHRRFKQATGTSPVRYRKAIRLHEARRRLAAGMGTVSEVAGAVGYVSPSQFSRDYKRSFGVSPSVDLVERSIAAGVALS